ncbi:MAG: SGNH/GDSL hydrolase family protein [Okeania sp. SIO3I5]|uniref:SGNH/GDSL hydrolase family protein n=1 Tax=Okeania sp. SIO3I5 TaxID=2607805 RepID=UPI0013BE3141|nr:SGNH/GDSL hydrolase family protein [Okeania sp. SIO3I5]NEQ41563.1 SGNH/GDSL hydrolase family protein [Okeania sp. SIO3I5]
MNKLKVLAVNLGIIFASLFVGVAIAEVGVRIAGLEGLKKISESTHAEYYPKFYIIPHPVRGWEHRANVSGWSINEEGKAYLEFNNYGLRGPKITKAKPENTLRIAVLGDSFTSAVQVSYKQTFVGVMQKELKKCTNFKGKKVQVINFGVNGYGTAQQLLTLREKVWDFQPDIVLLAFFNRNDVINNSRKLENNHYRPFFVYKKGKLELDLSFRKLDTSHANSYMITTVDKLPTWLVNNIRILQLMKKVEADQKKRYVGRHFKKLQANNFREPPNSAWQEAWKITDELIGIIAKEVQEKGVEFKIATVMSHVQVHPDKEWRERYTKTMDIQDWSYPTRRLKKLGEIHNFSVIDLIEPFQNYIAENPVCVHGFKNTKMCSGHWNATGHKLAGEIIAENLCQGF